MPNLKKVLNLHEAATELRLRDVCERHGARVFTKVRLADVLPIEGSGLADTEYRFALMAHLDFLIADAQHDPLFAVEFDGPSHTSEEQAARDETKDALCDRFNLPLLRINSNYLHAKYRNMDLLSWFVEVWFAARWFDEAQRAGEIPHDDIFMPIAMISLPGRKERHPLWLSAPIRNKVQKLYFDERVKAMIPSVFIGKDSQDTYRALAYLQVTDDAGVVAETGMRSQRFPVSRAQALDELVIFDLYERLDSVLAGREDAVAMTAILARLKQMQESHQCRFAVNIP